MKQSHRLKTYTLAGLGIIMLGAFVLAGLIIGGVIHPRRLLEYYLPLPIVRWDTAAPEDHGLDQWKLDSLQANLEIRGTKAFLVVRQNKVVYEWYAPGYGPKTRHGTASLAKSLVGGMALLVALNDERVDPDDPAWKYIPAWQDDPLRSKITIRHLATHSSGIEHPNKPDKTQGNEAGWKGVYWRERPRRFSIALTQAPILFPPGSQFHYSGPGTSALAYAITASLQNAPQADIRTLLMERLMDPMGVPANAWSISYGESYEIDGMILYDFAGGGAYTARAAARVGQLMLDKGLWEGQQLVDAAAVELAISHASPPGMKRPLDEPSPGLGWWTNHDGTWSSLPDDAFAGVGIDHQLLLVIPSLDLVVVRFGNQLGESRPNQDGDYYDDLEKYLFEPLMETLVQP